MKTILFKMTAPLSTSYANCSLFSDKSQIHFAATIQDTFSSFWEQVGNLSSLTKKSRAEGSTYNLHLKNKAESEQEAVLSNKFLLCIQMIYNLGLLYLKSIMHTLLLFWADFFGI